ncbi:MAG: OST-HTH/LOTUS domain-containing protein [Rhodocyclaceae bacterium]|nr:OST-HTH/LOTUS domain-containing protein [Rhodocyclaceae bacterium]
MSSDLQPPSPGQFVSLQHAVQRKLGRCLIRLQQYERLMKSLVADHRISGPARALMDIRAARVEALSKKTLGHLVGELTENILTPDAPVSDAPENDDAPDNLVEPNFQLQIKIALPDECYEETLAGLRTLVDVRNELVHHFLEKHDIWSETGCLDAQAYLDDCYQQVDTHYRELEGWAKDYVNAGQLIGRFMETTEYRDFVLHGIRPEGAGVEWGSSTIVNLLRKSETTLSRDGWTSLNDAIALIKKAHPEHTPRRYGCRSWRQVLHESREFLVRKKARTDSSLPTETWYRSKP